MKSGVNKLTESTDTTFVDLATGDLSGLLGWDEFDNICELIMQKSDAGWYIYPIDEQPPQEMASGVVLIDFIAALKQSVHKEYGRRHCGIAFVDSISEPTLFKVFNPKLLKSICNIYGNAPLHGWIVSRHRPVDLHAIASNKTHLQNNENRATKAAEILDARHTGCPLPIINTCRALQGLSKGELLEIMTIEPGAVKDVAIICERTGDKLVSHAQTRYGYSLFVEKA